MENDKTDLLADIAEYYSTKLALHGATPQGVDWNSEESQALRFEQLCKIINTSNTFSVNDIGCGYGAFLDYLTQKNKSFSYTGLDVSEDMIISAIQRNQDKANVRFIATKIPPQVSDYSFASGIFNVCLDKNHKEWKSYITATLDILNNTSRMGFAFNCLTSYSDPDKMRDYLYYADPCELFDFCKRHYSRNVALLHDYDLYEFTILVKKQS